jgi:prepilin-type N-terminal cleavage/methylation domain-containing protein
VDHDSTQLAVVATDIQNIVSIPSMNNSAPTPRLFASRHSGFSLVEMIGVLAIIAILAVVIVPKVFSTIASSRITSAVGSVNSMKSAVTEWAGKYGTIPVTTATASARIDDVLIADGMLEGRFIVKVGTPPPAVPVGGATYDRTTALWTAGAGAQNTQSRIMCAASVAAAAPATGTNYQLDGLTNIPAGSRIVSAVIMGVPISDAREISQRIDGDALTQVSGAITADTVGKVVYAAAANANATTNVYIYVAHQ